MPDRSPLVTCAMPTADRRAFVPGAIDLFLRQDYLDAELLILDDGADAIGDLVPAHDRIRYVRETRKANVGVKRNRLCEMARGEVILHWDDDDWAAPWRVRYQVEQLLAAGADVCGLDRVLFYAPASDEAWEYVYPRGPAPWVYGATALLHEGVLAPEPVPAGVGRRGQPLRLVEPVQEGVPARRSAVLRRHGACGEHEHQADARLSMGPVPGCIRARAADASRRTIAGGVRTCMPVALVSAARGIGDILRITPLVRVCRRLGYDVDLLLAPDYPEVVALLEGHADVRRVFLMPSPWRGTARSESTGSAGRCTTWPHSPRGVCRTERSCGRDACWRSIGRPGSVRAMRHPPAGSQRRSAGSARCPLPSPCRHRVDSTSRQARLPFTRDANRTGPGRSGMASKSSPAACRLSSSSARTTIRRTSDTYFPAPHGVASARSRLLGHARARRHRGTDPSIVGVRGQRFGLDASGCGARRAHVRHLRHHEPAARGHRRAEHARDQQTAAVRASLPQRRVGAARL